MGAAVVFLCSDSVILQTPREVGAVVGIGSWNPWQQRQASHAPREVDPECGLAAVASHASSWKGGALTYRLFVELLATALAPVCAYPWNLRWQLWLAPSPGVCVGRLWAYGERSFCDTPLLLRPLTVVPCLSEEPGLLLGLPSVVVYYLVAPSDCLHTANSSPVPWAWPPKPKPQDTSSTCPSGWMDKHLRLWGADQHQQSVQVSLGFVLCTSVAELSSEALFPPLSVTADLISEGTSQCAEAFSSFTAPSQRHRSCPDSFLYFLYSFALPCYVEIFMLLWKSVFWYCSVDVLCKLVYMWMYFWWICGRRALHPISHIFLLGYLPFKNFSSEGVHYPKKLILYYTWEVFSFRMLLIWYVKFF